MLAYTKDNIHYAHPVTVRDGRVRYDRALDNYFNVGIMDKVLDSFKPRDNVRWIIYIPINSDIISTALQHCSSCLGLAPPLLRQSNKKFTS
jgi:hypothetical protein